MNVRDYLTLWYATREKKTKQHFSFFILQTKRATIQPVSYDLTTYFEYFSSDNISVYYVG